MIRFSLSRTLILLLLLATITLLAGWLYQHPGMVTIEWLYYHIEIPIAIAALLLLILFLTITVIWRLLRMVFFLPHRIRQKRTIRRHEETIAAISKGFTAIVSGDARTAEFAIKKLEKLLGAAAPLTLLLKTEVAKLENRPKDLNKNYQAMLKDKQMELPGLLGLLAEAQRREDFDKALEIAEKIRARGAGADMQKAMPALLSLYKRSGKFEAAEAMLDTHQPTNRRFLGATADDALWKKEKAMIRFLRAKELAHTGKAQEAFSRLEDAYKDLPHFLPLQVALIETALGLDKVKEAQSLLKEAWKLQPHPELTRLFYKIHSGSTPQELMKKAEKLVGSSKEGESLKLLAETALAAKSYVKARKYIEMGLVNTSSAPGIFYQMMATLEEVATPPDRTNIQEWKRKASSAGTHNPWKCEACSKPLKEWQLQCPSCGAIEAVMPG